MVEDDKHELEITISIAELSNGGFILKWVNEPLKDVAEHGYWNPEMEAGRRAFTNWKDLVAALPDIVPGDFDLEGFI